METKQKFRSLIVDDNMQCISSLKRLLDKYFNEIEVIGTCHNLEGAVRFLKKETVDILFLDVEMPDGEGTSLFDYLDEVNFETIFTTAFPDYAAEAFRLNSIDYLVKPIKPSQLKEAISKVKKKKGVFDENESFITDAPRNKKIRLHTLDAIIMLNISDVVYCEAENNYTTFYTEDKKVVVSKTLGHYEKMLESYDFFRISRAHLVNLNFVEKLEKAGTLEISLANGKELAVSGGKKKNLLEAMNKISLNQM